MSTQIDITIAEVWKNGLAKQGEEIEWNRDLQGSFIGKKNEWYHCRYLEVR